MERPKATHGKPRNLATRARGACIRIGTEGVQYGTTAVAFWLTLEEAEAVASELAAAIRLAKGLAISGLDPQPPVANAAAIPKAA